MRPEGVIAEPAVQKSVDVLATNTYYTFACGPVELDVVFTAPMLINDYDLLSTPINYISYQVRSTDEKKHDVQFYLGATPLQSVNHEFQPTVSSIGEEEEVRYVRTGTIEQPILAKSDDDICIDWGYFYLPAINGEVTLTRGGEAETVFAETGALPMTDTTIVARSPGEMPTLAYSNNLGEVKTASSYAIVAYDEVWDIEYMYKHYKAYWAHNGQISIFEAFRRMNERYPDIMRRCRKLDAQIYDDGMAAGGKEYAELLSGSYRHVIAAHKLFQDDEGHLLWFSKENDSNGCVNTVDVTYPSVPLFLLYNPEFVKGMLTSIFEYSLTGCWTRPYPSHDLGTYPLANGRFNGDQGMPVEEAGNMLILSAVLCEMDGNTKYVEPYWELLTTWVKYLQNYGVDPEDQLCTDDFAGHLAYNCNLSLKGILGIAAYGKLFSEQKYIEIAKEYAKQWEKDASNEMATKLAFDKDNSWSIKYNIVWDRLLGINIFDRKISEREVNFYMSKMNKYGVPLDSREDYTKFDWLFWSTAMTDNKEYQEAVIDAAYRYISETADRVPISDWYYTTNGRMVMFQNRTVLGGIFINLL